MIIMNEQFYENEPLSEIKAEVEELSLGDDIEIDDSFFDDEVDVVRAEFLSDANELAISFNNCQLYVNMACIKRLPDTDYVQLLINRTKNQLALRPCNEDDRDAFLWRTINRKSGKRQPKYITAKIFSAMLFDYTGWDTNYRYRLFGKIKQSRGITLIVFVLSAYKAFPKTKPDGERSGRSNRGYFPSDWKNQFGLPVEEHDRSYEVNTFNNCAVMDIVTAESHDLADEPEEDHGEVGEDNE